MRVGFMKCHSIDGIYDVTFAVNTHAPTKRHVQNKCFTFVLRGVGEGWQGGHVSPLSKVCGGGGAQVGLWPPPFGQSKCFNFTICSYFVIKKQICIFFLGSRRSPAFINKYFPNFANLKILEYFFQISFFSCITKYTYRYQ